MDVSANLNGSGHFYEHGLFEEDGLDGADESKDVVLAQLDQLARFGRADFEESGD